MRPDAEVHHLPRDRQALSLLRTILQLAQALGIKPYQLFFEDGDIEAFDREELLLRYSEELKEGFAALVDAKCHEKLKRKKR